ncbi:hypothetical protein BC834DRAFT_613816 [Gloeopeniophorella convolvens]|nr:hypothetical protein BC834DRAFT_613816 [Gloeopeniophorella convolvens]
MAAINPTPSRGMSWRKPVPTFIPSPPASRPASDTVFTLATSASDGSASRHTRGQNSQSTVPPIPQNWRTIIGNATEEIKREPSHSECGVVAPPEPVYNELIRTASMITEDWRPPSVRCHSPRRAAMPKIYRPPTPPLPSARRPKSTAAPGAYDSLTSLGRSYRMVCRSATPLAYGPHKTLFRSQIYPDPPSLVMKDSYQTLRRSSAPSLCLSDSTRLPTSVTTRPSVQSMTSSNEHTAVSSHADIGSWYLPDDLQAEWELGLSLGLQNEKTQARKSKGNLQPGLPMHYIPASRLKNSQKQRSCPGMLWGAMSSFGQALASLFRSTPAESNLAATP